MPWHGSPPRRPGKTNACCSPPMGKWVRPPLWVATPNHTRGGVRPGRGVHRRAGTPHRSPCNPFLSEDGDWPTPFGAARRRSRQPEHARSIPGYAWAELGEPLRPLTGHFAQSPSVRELFLVDPTGPARAARFKITREPMGIEQNGQ